MTDSWIQILSKAGCNEKEAKKWAPYFSKYCTQYKINTPLRVAAFLANVVIESQYLRVVRENLNYSAKGLANTWPNRYSVTGKRGGAPNAKALAIAGKPVAIANHCYANRMGNGPEHTGDGWRYSGKGPIQVTGKNNTMSFFKFCHLGTDTNPERLIEAELGTLSAVWFWTSKGINRFADKGDFDGCCDTVNIGGKTRLNGDAHGYNARYTVYKRLLDFLSSNPKLLKPKEQVSVLTEKEIKETIAPEITWIEQDPDSEYQFESVEKFTAL